MDVRLEREVEAPRVVLSERERLQVVQERLEVDVTGNPPQPAERVLQARQAQVRSESQAFPSPVFVP
ncbi:MAG: hypothetical protein D6770_06015 [Anaerolineae bacterium]|nr:MAG: hypothetical protein D6770_06015 [Anaerolineae bacterium]